MSHIKKFESYRKAIKAQKLKQKEIKESVNVIENDGTTIYKVRVTAEIPQSLINAFAKKTKDTNGKNAKQQYSDIELAEEMTKMVLKNGLNIDKLDPTELFGGKPMQNNNVGQDNQQNQQPQDQNDQQPEDNDSGNESEVKVSTDDNYENVDGDQDGDEENNEEEGDHIEDEENEELPA